MKIRRILFMFLSTLFGLWLQAQENLLRNPSFEDYKPGYNGFLTITSGKVKGMSGKWQVVFSKGGCPTGCAKGSASVVTGSKVSGSNALEVKIDSQVNRNDIRVFQSIEQVPAGIYEVSFYAKSDVPSPISIDALKSTQQSTNNGAEPFTGMFATTTIWQQFKFTIDISGWSDDERNEMRISIRLNNTKALPQGPYPKTFWLDDIVMVKKQ